MIDYSLSEDYDEKYFVENFEKKINRLELLIEWLITVENRCDLIEWILSWFVKSTAASDTNAYVHKVVELRASINGEHDSST